MGNIIRKTGNGNTKLLNEKQLNNQQSKKELYFIKTEVLILTKLTKYLFT